MKPPIAFRELSSTLLWNSVPEASCNFLKPFLFNFPLYVASFSNIRSATSLQKQNLITTMMHVSFRDCMSANSIENHFWGVIR